MELITYLKKTDICRLYWSTYGLYEKRLILRELIICAKHETQLSMKFISYVRL